MFEDYILNDYLRAFCLLIASFLVLRVFIFILEKIILKFTTKTKTSMDDIILKKTSKPITFMVLLIGLRISFLELPLAESTEILITKIVLSLIALSVIYVVGFLINLIISRSLEIYSKRNKFNNQGIVNLIEGTLKVVWFLVAIIYVLHYWGIEIGPLLAGIGIGGIAIAFALQASLANIFAGVSMILDKTVRVGDLVNLNDGTAGKILKISLRATKIKTFDNEVVIVPNSKLADSTIKNVALPEPKSRTVIPFGVAYGSDIDKVKKIVLAEIKKVKGFVENPEPIVRFLEMADSSLNFKAYFFVNNFEDRFAAIDEANTRIYKALNKNKIEIPFPQMDVNLKK